MDRPGAPAAHAAALQASVSGLGHGGLAGILALALALAAAAAAPDGDSDPIALHWRPRAPGERFDLVSEAHVDLTAQLGTGVLAQSLEYDLREEERLEVEVLEPLQPAGAEGAEDAPPAGAEGAEDAPPAAAGGSLGTRPAPVQPSAAGLAPAQRRFRLAYPLRKVTTVAPLVGRRVKDRRVAGLAFEVIDAPEGVLVLDEDGAPTREKEARYVRGSFAALELEAALAGLLPVDGRAELRPGQLLPADAAAARSILGLPLEEITPESLELHVVGLDDDGALRFDVTARLTGQAELAGHSLRLAGSVAGPLLVDPATGRLRRMELEGPVTITSEGSDASMAVSGQGTLLLRRALAERDR